MNLLCPNCQKMLQVPEHQSGQMTTCPHCNGPFLVPALPKIPMPSSSPPSPAPAPSAERKTETQPTPPPSPEDYRNSWTLWLSPKVMEWVPSACLILVLFVLFLPWLDIYTLGSRTASTKNGWHSIFSTGHGAAALAYVVLFFPALLATLAAVILPRLDPTSLPLPIRNLVGWRVPIVLGTTLVVFLFFSVQLIFGFGIENANDVLVFRTAWVTVATLLHLTAIAGAMLHLWLTVRASRPLPRIDVHW